MDIQERLTVTRDMIWQINTNQDILELLSYDLHESPSLIEGNEGVFYIWRSIMGWQILELSKLIKDNGAFSLKKLINIDGATIKSSDKHRLMDEYDFILNEYGYP